MNPCISGVFCARLDPLVNRASLRGSLLLPDPSNGPQFPRLFPCLAAHRRERSLGKPMFLKATCAGGRSNVLRGHLRMAVGSVPGEPGGSGQITQPLCTGFPCQSTGSRVTGPPRALENLKCGDTNAYREVPAEEGWARWLFSSHRPPTRCRCEGFSEAATVSPGPFLQAPRLLTGVWRTYEGR